jgi:16S rRNA (uracil1498-N3)-methyltransferase
VPHFHVPPGNVNGGRFFLEPDESRHLAVVLRKKPGDAVELFDGADRSFRAVLEAVSPERVEGRILSSSAAPLLSYRLRLFQGLPKGDKMDFILEKMTELGAAEVVPVVTERSVLRLPPDRLPGRLERWRKILLAAAKQCGQSRVPAVSEPVDFRAALSLCGPGSLILFPWEGEERLGLKQVLQEERPAAVDLFIGPEGGFSPKEAELARERGARLVTLGPLVLRTETAGLMAASALLYELGQSPSTNC